MLCGLRDRLQAVLPYSEGAEREGAVAAGEDLRSQL